MKALYYIKQNQLAFVISFFYVSFGGLLACSMYPNDPLNGGWWFFSWIITIPVNILSSAYRATVSQNYFPVLIIQLIMLIPTFVVFAQQIKKISNKRG
jgi:hypothetical protein